MSDAASDPGLDWVDDFTKMFASLGMCEFLFSFFYFKVLWGCQGSQEECSTWSPQHGFTYYQMSNLAFALKETLC